MGDDRLSVYRLPWELSEELEMIARSEKKQRTRRCKRARGRGIRTVNVEDL